MAQAYGLMLIFHFIKATYGPNNDMLLPDEKKTTAYHVTRFVMPIIGPFITLGVGWVVFNYFM